MKNKVNVSVVIIRRQRQEHKSDKLSVINPTNQAADRF